MKDFPVSIEFEHFIVFQHLTPLLVPWKLTLEFTGLSTTADHPFWKQKSVCVLEWEEA